MTQLHRTRSTCKETRCELRSPYLTGDIALDAVLAEIDAKIADKAVTAGIRSGMVVIKKGIQSQLKDTGAKAAIGQKLKKVRKGLYTAKVGGAVGQKQGDLASRNRPGVGISARNIHWMLAGTADRQTGYKRVRTGRDPEKRGAYTYNLKRTHKPIAFRGRMPANPAVQKGFSQSEAAAMLAVRNRITIVLNREIQRATQQHKAKG